MRYLVVTVAIALALLSSVSVSQQTAPTGDPHRALLDQYCVGCHNQRSKTANLMLDTMDLAQIPKDAETWEKAIRKLRGGLMPPPGSRQPDRAAVESFVSFLETTLDKAAAANPNPGTIALHRLNRAEYANAMRELLAIDVDAAALLPVDDISDGFDNIANVLKVSPSFLDQYVDAARAVTKQAIGVPLSSQPARTTVRAGVLDSDPFVSAGIPLGTQPTLVADHVFPADGEYEIRANGGAIVTLDGNKLPANGRIALRAGAHQIGVASAVRSFVESENALQSFVPGAGGAVGGGGGRGGGGGGANIQVTGPYTPVSAVADTPSRQRIFVCHPANESQELTCANEILTGFARQAFRRPVTEKDLAAPLAFFKDGRGTGDFESGVQLGLMTILASPKFLYRAEPVPANVAPGANYKITDLELASRLSFFLWSQIPDDKLLDLAVSRKTSDPATLEQQVRRMLADPRAESLVSNFAFQWLKVRDTDKIEPDAVLFPNFDQSLRQAFRREIELFVGSVFHEDRSVLDLMNGNYTFVNERLAAHYGIPDVRGNLFRRVMLTDPNRWGLLGKGSILMVSSYPNRTAPVLRGAFILENLMGTPPAAPPPDVEGFKENKEGEKAKTVREIMELHRSKASCNGCHGIMDPLGFALENFDAIGAWRSKDRYAGTGIDASGKLSDGTPVNSAADVRKALMKRPEQFARTITERLMTYALGRSVEYYDMPTVRRIVRDSAKDNYRFSSIVLGIVRSAPFQMKRAPVVDKAAANE
jgi:mono/diheme cytochrome c family protein